MQVFRIWVAVGAVLGGLAVAGAAYAAHASIDPARARSLASAVQMQGWHALALVACGIWVQWGGWPVHVAACLFLVGTLLFCGAIWAPLLGGPGIGGVAPFGGTLLMAGWLALALSAFRAPAGP